MADCKTKRAEGYLSWRYDVNKLTLHKEKANPFYEKELRRVG